MVILQMKEIFSNIHKNNLWNDPESVSGPGSNTEETKVIREEIPKLLKQYDIKSVLDIPCGDRFWINKIDLTGIEYRGADIVDGLGYEVLDITSDLLPKVDLILTRDCLVHFSDGDIFKALNNICNSGSKYLLTTSFYDRDNTSNIPTGGWRPINLNHTPYNLPEPIYILNEGCVAYDGLFPDKSLGLYLISDIKNKFDRMKLEALYEHYCTFTPSDINEHLPTLKYLAEQCSSVTEFGVRTGLSSTALLMGNNNVVSYDLETNKCVEDIQKLAPYWDFNIGDTTKIEIKQTDMLFIDTLHNGDQLEKELERHSEKVSKYIAFHDTTTFSLKGETNENGLRPFMDKFLANHKEWRLLKEFTNNNGLTIRTRVPKIIVYTAIYGDYEVLKKQPEQTIDCDFVCFTDDPRLESEEGARELWEVKVMDGKEGLSKAMEAKYYRTHPFSMFDNQIVIYIDGSARLLRNDSVEQILKDFLIKSDIMTFRHPDRNCAYDEMEFCKSVGKNTNPDMEKQMEHYMELGHPKRYGLSATGMLVFNKSDSLIDALDQRWIENRTRGPNCQLSFDHIMRTNKIKRQFFNPKKDLRDNDIIQFLDHKQK